MFNWEKGTCMQYLQNGPGFKDGIWWLKNKGTSANLQNGTHTVRIFVTLCMTISNVPRFYEVWTDY